MSITQRRTLYFTQTSPYCYRSGIEDDIKKALEK